MKFSLAIYNNYDTQAEPYTYGQYETYADAVRAAEAVVKEFLMGYWRPGATAAGLLQGYAQYGEAPVVLPHEPGEQQPFSARAYARQVADELCQDSEATAAA